MGYVSLPEGKSTIFQQEMTFTNNGMTTELQLVDLETILLE